jgi:hypothetical protein
VNVGSDAPPGVKFGHASVTFPFSQARSKLTMPYDGLWMKRISLGEAPPPRGLAGTLDEAREGWTKLLPEGAWELLQTSESSDVEASLATLTGLMDANPENGLLVRLSLPISATLPDLSVAEVLSRRLVTAYPHVNAKYGLADVLGCMQGDAKQSEAELLFREVLAEQSMMTRARLKLALLLVDRGRRDEAIVELEQVASSWGEDAEEAKGYLNQLGVPVSSSEDGPPAVPRIVFTTVGELPGLPARITADHGHLAAWIYTNDAEAPMGLFDRLPEGEMAAGDVETIVSSFRKLSESHAATLVEVLGSGERNAGFHVGGAAEEVRRSFEDDGFRFVGRIVRGELMIDDDRPSDEPGPG